MRLWGLVFGLFAVAVSGSVACKSKSTEPSPTGNGGGGSVTLTAPSADAPADRTQLATLRPTLTVRNGTSTGSGPRVYEFQISDQLAFASVAPASASRYFAVVVNSTDVAEGSNGTTSFTPSQDLQPTTRFYWRARMREGTTVSAW
jgi:hypothetical protein